MMNSFYRDAHDYVHFLNNEYEYSLGARLTDKVGQPIALNETSLLSLDPCSVCCLAQMPHSLVSGKSK